MSYQIALYAGAYSPRPEEVRTTSWEGVVQLLSTSQQTQCGCSLDVIDKTCRSKFGRAWSPVEIAACPSKCHRFGTDSDCGGDKLHRLNANVRAVNLAVFDLDNTNTDALEKCLRRFDRDNLRFIAHSTHSHRPLDGRFSLRLVLPLSRPVTPAEWRRLRKAVEQEYKIPAVDAQTKDLSRIYFLPTHPTGLDPVFHEGTGTNVINVDVHLGVRSGTVVLAQQQEQLDTGPVREALRAARRQYKLNGDEERAALVDRVLKGEPLAEPTKRDATLLQLAGIMSSRTHIDTPADVVVEACRVSIDLIEGEPDNLPTWLDVFREKFTRLREQDRAEYERRAQETAEQHERLLAVTEARLAAQAEQRIEVAPPARPEDKHLIIQRGRSFWIWNGADYGVEATNDDFDLHAQQALTGVVPLTVEDKRGNSRPMRRQEILQSYATAALQVQQSMVVPRSNFDPFTLTLTLRVCKQRVFKTEFHADVDEWLGLLGGTKAEQLKDWLAGVPRLERQAAALYIFGAAGAGKTILANGLARIWSTRGPGDLERALEGFNETLTTCPVLFADEYIPQKRNILENLRKLIGAPTHEINAKFRAPTTLHGRHRLIFSANNSNLFTTSADLSREDVRASASRFLFIEAPRAASDYLQVKAKELREQNPDGDLYAAWVHTDKIAQHVLWLANNRKIPTDVRFLGQDPEDAESNFQRLTTSSRRVNEIFEFVVGYLTDGSTANDSRPPVLAGGGEIWVSPKLMAQEGTWERFVTGSKPPSTSQAADKLRLVAKPEGKIKVGYGHGGAIIYMVCDGEPFLSWAQAKGCYDLEELSKQVTDGDVRATVRSRKGRVSSDAQPTETTTATGGVH